MPEAFAIPLAHVGHYLWILYVLPVLIVVASIIRTTLSERRRRSVSARDHEGPLIPETGAAAGARVGEAAESDPPAGGRPAEAENENLARRPAAD